MRRGVLIAVVLSVATFTTPAISHAATDQTSGLSYGTPYTAVMPTKAQYPAGFWFGGEPFMAYGEEMCQKVTASCPRGRAYEVDQMVWGVNQDAALRYGLIDGARTLAMGPGYQPQGCVPGIAAYWVTVARFPTAAAAAAMANSFTSPLITPSSVSTQSTVGLDAISARYVTAPTSDRGHYGDVVQVTFSRGPMAVMIYSAYADAQETVALGRTIDANILRTGFGLQASVAHGMRSLKHVFQR